MSECRGHLSHVHMTLTETVVGRMMVASVGTESVAIHASDEASQVRYLILIAPSLLLVLSYVHIVTVMAAPAGLLDKRRTARRKIGHGGGYPRHSDENEQGDCQGCADGEQSSQNTDAFRPSGMWLLMRCTALYGAFVVEAKRNVFCRWRCLFLVRVIHVLVGINPSTEQDIKCCESTGLSQRVLNKSFE